MLGNDLIVEIPWIVFGLLLVAVFLRLRRFSRFSGQSRRRDTGQPSEDGDDTSANTDEPSGNAHHGVAAAAPTQPTQTQPTQTRP